MARKIMAIEDDTSIVTLLEHILTKAEYEVVTFTDGLAALHSFDEVNPDLIMLDLMLPGMNGLDVCRNLQQKNPQLPIIMLTALSEEFDKVLGLELGADDYITKPFSTREVLSRVKAVLRRSSPALDALNNKEEHLTTADLEVYPQRYEAYFKQQALELTVKEFQLLVYFLKNKNLVLSRDQLLNEVWDFDFVGDTRIVDVHISKLREKIERDSKQPQYIKTIRGFGYKLVEASKA